MFGKLVKLANRFDQSGMPHMADKVDKLILALAQEIGGNINLVELMRLKPDVIMSLSKAISFDLVLEPDPDGRGNSVRAIPKIHDKWTDGLNLGDMSNLTELQGHMMPAAVDETMNKIEEGGWFEEGADLPTLSEEEFGFDPEYVAQEKQNEEQKKKELDEALSGASEAVEREQMLPREDRSPEVKQRDIGEAAEEATNTIEMWPNDTAEPFFSPEDFKAREEGKVAGDKTLQERTRMRETEVRAKLVKMADDFDQAGLHDLAAEVDRTLKSLSARPKAPLKKLDDDIKKNLIVFVHDADKNTSKSIKGLNELFRRMRYFDFSDAAKDLGLDRAVKDMEKTRGSLEEAKRKFYEMMHGKKPSKKDLEELFDSLVDGIEESKEQPALDFFDDQLRREEPEPEKELEEDTEEPVEEDVDEEEEEISEEMEKELDAFLSELEEGAEPEDDELDEDYDEGDE